MITNKFINLRNYTQINVDHLKKLLGIFLLYTDLMGML